MPQFPRVGDLFGRYRIDAQIGQGGMGVVFSATDTAFDRRVALKVVSAALGGSAEFLARFEREAALLARLNSPHVIAIFDYGEQDGCPYLATQYVGGGDLGGLLAARGPMPPKLALEVCAQVADALADAHRAGVVHRDVKPTNVLLRDADTLDLHAYLCDFGIARTDSEGLTAPGSVSGTWSYLAPECGTGAPGTVSSDLYALGCLLWATLTGQAPFRGTDVEIAIAHQRAPVPQLADDPDGDPFTRHVNAILANTLAKDPRSRYDDADAVRADLLAAAAIPSTGVRPLPTVTPARPVPLPTAPPGSAPDRISLGSLPPSSPLAPPRRRRTALVVAAACVAVLGVTGGVVAATWTGDDPTGPASPDPSTTATTSGGATTSPAPEPPAVVGPVSSDIDGDGLGDLAVREFVEPKRGKGEYELITWTSTGTGFGEPSSVPDATPKDMSRSHALADLDGDDLLELVVLDTPNESGKVTITAELSAGGSLTQRLPRPTGGGYVSAYPGDADGDGIEDLVLLAWGKKKMSAWVARSTGSSLEDPRRALRLDTGYEESKVEVGDFDGDDRVDVAVLVTRDGQERSPWTSTLDLYVGDGGRRFTPDGASRSFPTTIGNYFVSGDFDGDEDTEIGLVEDRRTFMQLSVIDHRDGKLTRPRAWGLLPFETDGFFDSTLVTGDYDGDGLDDVLSLGPSSKPKVAEIQVATSTGKKFANATVWGTWRYELADTYGTSAIGETFP